MGFPSGSAAKNPPALLETQSLPLSQEGPRRRTWQPPQYPCLESPTDRGARRATVHGVLESAGPKQWSMAWHTTLFVQSDLYHFKMSISILQHALMTLFLNSAYVLYLLSMQVSLWPCDFKVTGNDGIILQTAGVRKQTFPLPAWV